MVFYTIYSITFLFFWFAFKCIVFKNFLGFNYLIKISILLSYVFYLSKNTSLLLFLRGKILNKKYNN